MRSLYPVVEEIFKNVNNLAKGAPSPPVEKSLVEPAKYIYFCLNSMSSKFEGDAVKAGWENLKMKLGSPEEVQKETLRELSLSNERKNSNEKKSDVERNLSGDRKIIKKSSDVHSSSSEKFSPRSTEKQLKN